MTRLNIFITVAIILQSVPRGSGTVERGATTSGYYIELNSGEINSQQLAKEFCESTGGWLSEPKTQSMSDDIAVMLSGLNGYYYSGLEKHSGVWKWKDGNKASWTNWDGGAPSGSGSCMRHGGGMAWFVSNCMQTNRFLCQYSLCNSETNCDTSNYYCAASDADDSIKYCKCKPGYHGSECAEQHCNSECKNGKICSPGKDQSYTCKCPFGSCGDDCQDASNVIGGGQTTEYSFELTCDSTYQEEAKRFCESKGGWLGEPKTAVISEYIRNHVLNGIASYFWSGLERVNGDWKWKDGDDTSSWANWKTNDQPIGAGNCMGHGGGMAWYNYNCERSEQFLCQYKSCNNDLDCNIPEQYCKTGDIAAAKKYCSCKAGYYGVECTQQYSCDQPCQNNGTCFIDYPSFDYKCQCTSGYHGEDCTDQHCSPECQNEGTCVFDSPSTNYKCQCNSGYYGNDCTEEYCDVHTNPCRNSGTCISDHTSPPYYGCSCASGYYGDICHEGYCDVNANPCKNGGTCSSDHNSSPYYDCSCASGYYGDICNEGYCDANTNPCNNGGTCKSDHTSAPYYDCKCVAGYYGNICSEGYCDVNANPCNNGGTCSSDHNSPPYYDCSCASGYYGDICNEGYCDVNANPCKNNGTCISDHKSAPYFYCNCSAGYFQELCGTDLIVISSQGNVTGVANDNLTIELDILSYDGPIIINITRNNTTVKMLIEGNNGTSYFTISNVQQADEGEYVFVAYPESEEYSRQTSTFVTVHVRAFIQAVSSEYIYAPQSVNQGCQRTITCTVGGIPSPKEKGWYRSGAPLNESSENRIYQVTDGESITLFVENATIFDEGAYTCSAFNRVSNETKMNEDNKTITLAVYGPPDEITPVAKNCSEEGEITVNWIPNNRTMNVNHTFYLSSENATLDYNESKTAQNGNPVIFAGLDPYTNYRTYVEVCPEDGCCIKQLNNEGYAVTGDGLPSNVTNATYALRGTTVCEVKWEEPATPTDQIEGYNIQWTASILNEVEDKVGEIVDSTFVMTSTRMFEIETLPNKKYTVSVSARTCAGNGISKTAVGACETPVAGPDKVPAPNPPPEDKSRKATRQVTIPMVTDEANGALSCIFVILYKGDRSGNITTLDDLYELSMNAAEGKVAEGYISMAMNRSQVDIGTNVNVTLGDGTRSKCDVFSISGKSAVRTKRVTVGSPIIFAENIPLDFNGQTYTQVTATTTPFDASYVIVTTSTTITFIQGEYVEPPFSPAIFVLIPLVVAGAVIAYIMYRRQANKKLESSSMAMSHRKDFVDIEDDEAYETVQFPPTVIQLKELMNYYNTMEADECLRFRDQYSDLKQKAKQLAPPTAYASSEDNMEKNRYRNILPYDTNRVMLRGEGKETYINASFIQGHRKKFIATQGPLPHTITDFWRMVVEQGCRIIVMLTRCDESGRRKCERYWPSANKAVSYGSYEITNVKEREIGGVVQRILKIYVPGQTEIKLTHYQYVRWPDHGVPSTTSTFFRLHRQVVEDYQSLQDEKPIIVHCSAGVGRTGTFIGYDLLLGQAKGSVDIYNCVLDMRRERLDMVQTSDQYQMLHKLMLENHLFKDVDFDPKDLPKKRKKLNVDVDLQKLRTSETMNSKSHEEANGGRTKVVIVRQPEDTEWVTINAAFVEAYKEKMNIIASEGPSRSTVEYFLRALWDNQVDAVVMLNDPSADITMYEAQYCDYWPSKPNQPQTYSNITITLRSENDIRGTIERTFQLSRRNAEPRNILQYQYIGWTDVSPPDRGDGVIDLVNRINRIDLGRPATILVHCTDGLSRTGIFIATANILERMNAENRIDVFRAVKDLRDIRPGMINSHNEYLCCYDIASYYLSQQNTYANDGFPREEPDKEIAEPIYENRQAQNE